MFNKKIVLSILVLGIAVSLAGAGTWAWFTDTQSSTANTFTAGTLKLRLSNDGTSYGPGVTATWKSPDAFKPGDTFSNELRFTNTGTVDARHIYMYPEHLTHTGGTGNVNLADKIIVTSLQGHFGNYYGWNIVPALALLTGNHDGILTLSEFCQNQYVAFSIFNLPVLKAEDKKDFGLLLKGKFSEKADNRYQGASCTFEMKNVASQNSPTEDYVKVNDEQTASGPDNSQDNIDLPADDSETQ